MSSFYSLRLYTVLLYWSRTGIIYFVQVLDTVNLAVALRVYTIYCSRILAVFEGTPDSGVNSCLIVFFLIALFNIAHV